MNRWIVLLILLVVAVGIFNNGKDESQPLVETRIGVPLGITVLPRGEISTSWFVLHDLNEETNRVMLESFGITLDNEWARDFALWTGSLGLFESDGREKPGWITWKQHFVSEQLLIP